jgi:predicted DNA-binding protein (MmcQ/YjbR family)
MNLETIRSYCLRKPGTTAETPFGPEVLVFKVLGKMFALTQNDPQPESISLKCDPDDALALRAQYNGVTPGYHLNKRHWNTVLLDGDVPQDEILAMIDTSYHLVAKGLPRRDRETLKRSFIPTTDS